MSAANPSFSHLPGLAYRCNNDPQWTMQFVSAGCLELTGYPSESLINNKDLSFNDLIAPKYRSLLREEWSRVLPKRIPFKYEYEITTKSGEQKWVLELGQGVYNDDGRWRLSKALYPTFRQETSRKQFKICQ